MKKAVFRQRPFTLNTTVIRGLREWPRVEWVVFGQRLIFFFYEGYSGQLGCGLWVKQAAFGQLPHWFVVGAPRPPSQEADAGLSFQRACLDVTRAEIWGHQPSQPSVGLRSYRCLGGRAIGCLFGKCGTNT